MTTANESVLVDETIGRWQSVLSSLAVLAQRLDYDPQDHVFVMLDKLVQSVSRLEARLTVLEQQDSDTAVLVVAEPEERR
ncbi:MAG: hypothetical protein O7F73_20325 [Gammaproteobacteria bacterium]|nr:hypothetical protein [Gammaproteobacteria bacterium]